MTAEEVLIKEIGNEYLPIKEIDSNLWDMILKAMEKYAVEVVKNEHQYNRSTVYKVLSNKGQVAGEYTSKIMAQSACDNINNGYCIGSDLFYSVVEITPYRLLVPIEKALELHSFPFEIDGNYAAWYMSEEEYMYQLTNASEFWVIKYKNGVLEAEFDDLWQDTWYK